MNMNTQKPIALLVNVGGSVAPAIHTLNEQQPPYVCFFVSKDSKPLIQEKILPALVYQLTHYDWIETPAPQNLLACYRALAGKLPRQLEDWGVLPEALAVEYTTGTKPMSVAAVLATIDTCSMYFYTGASDSSGRDRDGIGVVLDGRELTWFQTNPWEELAIPLRKEIALLFNHGRFTDAREKVLQLAKTASDEMRPVYESLAELIEGYAQWDRFEYRQAQVKIFKAYHNLSLYTAGRDDPLRKTLEIVNDHAAFLVKLNQINDTDPEKRLSAQRLDLLDMLASATRRADMAKKYDDAVARLYSALESLARNRLLNKHQIKTSAARVEQIPLALRDEYVRCYSDPGSPDKGLRLGLQASYQLLAALGDELGLLYVQHEGELNKVLNARNQSRLAHGTQPVRPEIYARLRGIIMNFAGIEEHELPRFPELQL